jgi:two-component system, cell cycle sensor histidine kinase and response regulator CckA
MLMMNEASSPSPPGRKGRTDAGGGSGSGEGTGTILVVEDDIAVGSVIRRSLERFGYEVLLVQNGTEAIRLATEHPEEIDLLLTDIVMPGMNGVQVADAVVKLRGEIRVLFMSGYADQELIRTGILSHHSRFLQKPFDPGELNRRVQETLERGSYGPN